MTMPDELPVLSSADRHAERSLLAPADLGGLQRRLERSLAHRTWLTGFTAGVASTVVLALLGIGAVVVRHDAAPAAARTGATVPTVAPIIAATMTPPCAVPPPVVAMTAAVPERVEQRVEQRVKEQPLLPVERPHRVEQGTAQRTGQPGAQHPAVEPLVADDDRAPVDGSRLRTQLRIFADGERALGGGDPARARARARHLREAWPAGPLEMDALILEIRALRAMGLVDDARRVLDDATAHPLAAEKATVLAELGALLAPSPVVAPSGDETTTESP